MKAARWHGVKDIRVEDIPEPKPGKGEVKIKVAWTGICGSDLHEYLAGPIFVPVGEEHPLSHDKAPITMGHEYCGTITELGEGVTGLSIGDRVAIEPIFACGTCPACLEGTYNLCDSLGFVGLSGGNGGLGAHIVVPARMVHKMPDALTKEQGALVEPADRIQPLIELDIERLEGPPCCRFENIQQCRTEGVRNDVGSKLQNARRSRSRELAVDDLA